MDGMDGILLVPPDPRQILGRALWKPRYVVVGRRGASRDQPNPSYTQVMTTSRIHASASTPRQPKPSQDEYVISLFKAKNRHRSPESPEHIGSYPVNPEDWELSATYPVNSVTDCQVQMVAHRKQGPVLPTLVISISDKDKKRRSSRAGGLIPSKENSSTSLWLRNPPDDHHPSLHDWSRFIMSRKLPMSPDSPASPQFINPFASRSREGPDYFNRPSSGNPNSRSGSTQKGFGQNGSRDRPVTFSSESPSLRSKRSDISSPSSITYQGQIGIAVPAQHYTTVLPTDLPSPTGTVGEYSNEFIEGWTAAQGRSSALSSPGRSRDSMSSPVQTPVGVAVPMMPGMDSSSPPGPRETILDRAFQLRCIPGSERRPIPGEEKLSSLARFDALMREADERRKRQEAAAEAEKKAMQSAWDIESSDEEEDDDEEDDDDADEYGAQQGSTIPPHAQRALEFIAGRHGARSPRPAEPAEPVQFDEDSLRTLTLHSHAPLTGPNRPRTAHAKSRPTVNQRTHSQPQLAGQLSTNNSLDVPTPSTRTSEESSSRGTNGEKRQSSSSTKRYSLNEFTKRLSSTSSLLLMQTNTSNASSRGSSEAETQSQMPRGALNPRGAPPVKDRDREEWEKRCGWRGSVGVFGSAEGGFL